MKPRVKIVKNTQPGSDSIEHLVGMEFEVDRIDNDELCIRHEGELVPLADEEYEYTT